MTSTAKRAAIIGGGIVALAAAIFFLVINKDGLDDIPVVGSLAGDPECPLTSRDPARDALVERLEDDVVPAGRAQDQRVRRHDRRFDDASAPYRARLRRVGAVIHRHEAREAALDRLLVDHLCML